MEDPEVPADLAGLIDQVELAMIRAMWQIPTKELRGVALEIGLDRVHGRFMYETKPGELEKELVDLCEFYLAIEFPEEYDVEFIAQQVPLDEDLLTREGERWFYLRYEQEDSSS